MDLQMADWPDHKNQRNSSHLNPGGDGEPIRINMYELVDLKGRPVNKAKTGARRTTLFFYALNMVDNETFIIAFTMVPYLITHMHQSTSKAATTVSNLLGTNFLCSVLGGFLGDAYLGSFWTIAVGILITILGYAILMVAVIYPGLQPASCLSNANCEPAGTRYMAPLYAAFYTVALGVGLVRPNILSHGADQFDDSVPEEKEQSTHFFAYLYFSAELGNIIALFPGVYLVEHVSAGWAYGASFILYVVCCAIFFLGTPLYRHRVPAGSFLTRTAKVLVAALMKRGVGLTAVHSHNLYDPPPTQREYKKLKLIHTNRMRFLDRAAVISGPEDQHIADRGAKSWRLCSVSQVEETKRILQMMPIWAATAFVNIVYSQFTTFSGQAAATFDRRLGSHFTIPASSVLGFDILTSLILIPIYDRIVVPFVRKFNHNPYGFTPLQRIGAATVFASLANVAGALLERKRLTSVRALNLESLRLGTYVLPLKVWWLYPQYFLASLCQINLLISSFEFFYREASVDTRSLASSFTFSASAFGFFFSSMIVGLVNRVTRHEQGGSWLEGQLNNGGLEKYYWLLSAILASNFLVYLICAYRYQYKYDWYHKDSPDTPSAKEEPGSKSLQAT